MSADFINYLGEGPVTELETRIKGRRLLDPKAIRVFGHHLRFITLMMAHTLTSKPTTLAYLISERSVAAVVAEMEKRMVGYERRYQLLLVLRKVCLWLAARQSRNTSGHVRADRFPAWGIIDRLGNSNKVAAKRSRLNRSILRPPTNLLQQSDITELVTCGLERMLAIQGQRGSEHNLSLRDRHDYSAYLIVCIISNHSVRPQVLRQLTRETLQWVEDRGEWVMAVECDDMKVTDPVLLPIHKVLSSSITWWMDHVVPQDHVGCVFPQHGRGFRPRVEFTEVVRRGVSLLIGRGDVTPRSMRPATATILLQHPNYDQTMERAAATVQNHSVSTHREFYARESRLELVRPIGDWLLREVAAAQGNPSGAAQTEVIDDEPAMEVDEEERKE